MNGGRFLFPFCTVMLPIRLHCEGVCVCVRWGGGGYSPVCTQTDAQWSTMGRSVRKQPPLPDDREESTARVKCGTVESGGKS